MYTPKPATIASNLFDRVNLLALSCTDYLNKESFQIRSLMVDAKKLIQVDPVDGHMATAFIQQLTGDTDSAKYHLDVASRLSPRNINLIGAKATLLTNLGFFSEAQSFHATSSDPKMGYCTKMGPLGIACGAIAKVCEHMEQVEKMKLNFENFPVHLVSLAHDVLNQANISDEDVGKVLDIAGDVMRTEKVFFAGDMPKIEVETDSSLGSPCVYLTYKITKPGKKVAEMTDALFDKIAISLANIPDALHVSFAPA